MAGRVRTIAAFSVLSLAAALAFASPASAATPDLVVGGATVLSPPEDLLIGGTATCSQPSGTATVEVRPVQPGPTGIAAGVGSTVITCASGPVAWQIAVRSYYSDWASGYFVGGSGTLTRAGVEEAYASISLYAS